MAKILCGISGIEFSCEYLPLYLDAREYAHPVFFLKPKKLLGLYNRYTAGEMGDKDSWLLFLAFWNATDLIEWRMPAKFHPEYSRAIIAQNFQSLVEMSERIQRVQHPAVTFARISVSQQTADFQNCRYWLESWSQTYTDFVSGYATKHERDTLAALEEKLDAFVRDSDSSEALYAARLADWADRAGNFPRFSVTLAAGKSLPCSDYWKQIIRKCTNAESIFSIPGSDLAELIEHCELNIDAGTQYSYNLLKILRAGARKQVDFLGGGINGFKFSVLQGDESIEAASKLAIVANAPRIEPARAQYPSNFQFLKAKLAWELAKKQAQGEQK